MSKMVVSDFKGVDTTTAKLLLDKGDLPFSQNLRPRPFKNLAKRRGTEPVSSQTDPIMGIFEIELDGIIIPMFQAGGQLTFFPDLTSASRPDGYDQYPAKDPLHPDGGGTFTLFALEKTMRAINERFARTNNVGVVFPPAIFGPSGILDGTIPHDAYSSVAGFAVAATQITYLNTKTHNTVSTQTLGSYYNTGVGNVSMPDNGFYGYDLGQWDTYFGRPVGTRGKELVNMIISGVFAGTGTANGVAACVSRYARNISSLVGATDVLYYDTASPTIVPVPATASTYQSRLVDCRTAIRKFEWVTITANTGTVTANSSREMLYDKPGALDPLVARPCVITNYPLVSPGNTNTYTNACVFVGTTARASGTGASALSQMDDSDLYFITDEGTFSATDTAKYPKVLGKELFTQFNLGLGPPFGQYVPPAAFGSPAELTYVALAINVNSYKLTQAQVDADLSTIMTTVTAPAPYFVGWVAINPIMALKLGPMTYQV